MSEWVRRSPATRFVRFTSMRLKYMNSLCFRCQKYLLVLVGVVGCFAAGPCLGHAGPLLHSYYPLNDGDHRTFSNSRYEFDDGVDVRTSFFGGRNAFAEDHSDGGFAGTLFYGVSD